MQGLRPRRLEAGRIELQIPQEILSGQKPMAEQKKISVFQLSRLPTAGSLLLLLLLVSVLVVLMHALQKLIQPVMLYGVRRMVVPIMNILIQFVCHPVADTCSMLTQRALEQAANPSIWSKQIIMAILYGPK